MVMPDVHQWVAFRLTAMDSTIWLVMSMSGVRIGIMKITTITLPLRTRQGRAQAPNGCCGVVIGSTLLAACGWLTAAAPLRILGTATTGFDVCQDPIRK